MKKQVFALRQSPLAVKLGTSRQVVIPKRLHDRLGLAPGDFLAVEVKEGSVVFTPKKLVDKHIEKRLAEALDDVRHGHIHGPYETAGELMKALRSRKQKYRR